jgi:hypothetical protein
MFADQVNKFGCSPEKYTTPKLTSSKSILTNDLKIHAFDILNAKLVI